MKKKTIIALLSLCALITQVAAEQKSDYSPLIKQGYSDYREAYNPNAKVVYESGDALLTTSHADISLERVKFFVPPGTKRFTVSFLTYLSSQESKATGRFRDVPTKTASEVQSATMIRNTSNTLERLVAGEELPFYSPGGSGNLGISEPYQFDNFQVNSGGYIYLHILSVPGGMVKTLQTRMVVDEACYRSWYANAKWDAQGNPDENATHTCAGSTGGGSSGGGSQVTTAEISGKSETVDANGNLVLNFTLKRPASETQSTNRTSFWIAAYVPAGFLPEEAWFFLTQSGWSQLLSTNPYAVAYRKSETPVAEKVFTVSAGLPVAEMRNFNAKLHFGYMGSDGGFKDMGMIWSSN